MDCQKLNIRLYLVSEEYKEKEIDANKNGFFIFGCDGKIWAKKPQRKMLKRLPLPIFLK